jgi:hypothetical protein
MNRPGRWIVLTVLAAALVAAGCQQPAAEAAVDEVIHIEELESGLDRLTLVPSAAGRLGIQTAAIEERGGALIAPYASIIYAADGTSWVYVATDGLVFERAEVTIDDIDGDTVLMSAGPPAGTQVVVVGAAELYGAETGVGGGH